MVILYTSPGCASCRKVKAWLKGNNLKYVERNIFSTQLTDSEIKYMLGRCENGTEDIISTRSKAFRGLSQDLDDMSINELVAFIRNNPSVLKRPIMLSEKSMVVGYDDDEVTAVIPKERRNMVASISFSV